MQADGAWRDVETLLLLEGVQLFGDNWAEIAAHVGTKSQVPACKQWRPPSIFPQSSHLHRLIPPVPWHA